jgi:hypothetical protein
MRCKQTLFGLALAAVVGCGDGWPKLVPVSGKVTLDGKALIFKSVYFHPQPGTPGTGAAAITKEDGSYTLLAIRYGATKVLPGAPPGAYRVVITEPRVPVQAAMPAEAPDSRQPAVGLPRPSRQRLAIPARYATPETTPLAVQVPAEGGTVDLQLTSHP